MKTIISIFATALIATAGLSAKGECKEDVKKFCPNLNKEDKQAFHDCITKNEAQFSEPCKNHLAEERENQKAIKKACKADFKKLCKDVKPGKGRVIQCLKSKEAELSQGCKDALVNTKLH